MAMLLTLMQKENGLHNHYSMPAKGVFLGTSPVPYLETFPEYTNSR